MTDQSIDWRIMGQNLSFCRGVKQMSRKDLARRLCIDEERLTRLEFGQEAFTIDILVRIALISGIEPRAILVGTEALDVQEANSRLREVLVNILNDVKNDGMTGGKTGARGRRLNAKKDPG